MGKKYGKIIFGIFCESPLILINLNEFKLDSNLDSFLLDTLTIEELETIKEIIISHEEYYINLVNFYLDYFNKPEILKTKISMK